MPRMAAIFTNNAVRRVTNRHESRPGAGKSQADVAGGRAVRAAHRQYGNDGDGLSTSQMKAVATFVTGKSSAPTRSPKRAYCCEPVARHRQAPGRPALERMGRRREPSVPIRRDGRLEAADTPRLKLKWAFGVSRRHPRQGQPSVAGGRLFVGSATARCTRSTQRPGASIGPSSRISACALPLPSAPSVNRLGSLLRRPGRQCVRRRRGDRQADLEDPRR